MDKRFVGWSVCYPILKPKISSRFPFLVWKGTPYMNTWKTRTNSIVRMIFPHNIHQFIPTYLCMIIPSVRMYSQIFIIHTYYKSMFILITSGLNVLIMNRQDNGRRPTKKWVMGITNSQHWMELSHESNHIISISILNIWTIWSYYLISSDITSLRSLMAACCACACCYNCVCLHGGGCCDKCSANEGKISYCSKAAKVGFGYCSTTLVSASAEAESGTCPCGVNCRCPRGCNCRVGGACPCCDD
jgi:hypothetical protein